MVIFVIIIIIIFISSKNRNNGQSISIPLDVSYTDVDPKLATKYNIDIKAIKKQTFDIYKNIQTAWMDFDYKSLRKYTTDEIYNTYVMQLDALKLKKQKNIMKDFEYLDAKVIGITDENGILNVEVYLNVKDYDYVVDENDKVLRGNDKLKMNIGYKITLVRKENNKPKETNCPNCGAKTDIVAGGKCPYCGTVMVIPAEEFVMSKKTCVSQRMEK